MYARTLRRNHHIRTFTIHAAERGGWEVREEENDQLLARIVYTDWHRVERARSVMEARAAGLKSAGWTEP